MKDVTVSAKEVERRFASGAGNAGEGEGEGEGQGDGEGEGEGNEEEVRLGEAVNESVEAAVAPLPLLSSLAFTTVISLSTAVSALASFFSSARMSKQSLTYSV